MNDPGSILRLLLIVLGFIVLIILFLLMFRRREGGRVRYVNVEGSGDAKGRQTATNGVPPQLRPCPICGTMLKKGERVKSAVFPGTPDSMSHIFGCLYCYPVNSDHPRICPVCKKPIAEDGYVVARMFDGKEKKHVHVLGCTGCRRVR